MGEFQVSMRVRRRAFLLANMGDRAIHLHVLRWKRLSPWGMYRGAVHAARSSILKVTRSKVRLHVGDTAAGDIVLVIELRSMRARAVVLVLLVGMPVVLVGGVVLERLAQVHLHGVPLVTVAAVHHGVVALSPVGVALVVHAKLLGRLLPPFIMALWP